MIKFKRLKGEIMMIMRMMKITFKIGFLELKFSREI